MIVMLMSVVARASMHSKTTCPMVKIEAERLPDLNIPRKQSFCLLLKRRGDGIRRTYDEFYTNPHGRIL